MRHSEASNHVDGDQTVNQLNLASQTEFEDQHFTELKCADASLVGKNFITCAFEKCDFSNANLSDSKFTECQFKQCDLSLIGITGCKLQDVYFEQCKVAGVDFTTCNVLLFEINFKACTITSCNFANLTLEGASFKECSIKESDFVDANLKGADFHKANLQGTLFDNCNLSEVNLVDAVDFEIDIRKNNLLKARVSISEAARLIESAGVIIEYGA